MNWNSPNFGYGTKLIVELEEAKKQVKSLDDFEFSGKLESECVCCFKNIGKPPIIECYGKYIVVGNVCEKCLSEVVKKG